MPDTVSPRSAPIKVVHCVMSLEIGGLERIVVDLVRMGKQQGLDVSVLCLERLGVLEAEATRYGATVTFLKKPPGIAPETVKHAEEFLARTRPDVVHTHQIGALWYIGRAARSVGVPVVVHTEHIDNVAKAKGWWKKLKSRVLWHRASRYAERFCCVSDDIARSARRWRTVARNKIAVVLNGVDTSGFEDADAAQKLRDELKIPPDHKIIGNVGRLFEVKRQDLLLSAFEKLKRQIPTIHLIIVGDGPERERLQEHARHLGITDSVTFAGYQSSPRKFLQIMDVFALTSRLEGLPLVLLEAWAAHLPVVSTAVGGVPDVVQHGENGLLVPNGDEAAIVSALKMLLENPKEAARYGDRGQARVREHYSLERMARDYQEQYQQLLSLKNREGQ